MSTSDERIRVARELNKSAQNMYKIWCNDLCDDPAANEMLEIDSIVTLETDVPANYTFTQLAKLIDPTCHNFGGEDGTNGENYEFACSACGWCGDITEPKYCPNCGSRVISDDSGKDNNSEQ